jgi:hypothetical protein
VADNEGISAVINYLNFSIKDVWEIVRLHWDYINALTINAWIFLSD